MADDPRVHRASGTLENLGLHLLDLPATLPASEEPEAAYLHLALRAVIEPDRLSEVPVAKLIKFRDKYSAELAAFRGHIAGLGTELQEVALVTNPTVAQAHLDVLYETRTRPMLDELRRGLRGLGVSSTVGTLALKFDLNAATGTVIGGLAAMAGQPAIAGAAIALCVLPYAAEWVTGRRELRAQSSVAYLLAADRKLNGPALLRSFRR